MRIRVALKRAVFVVLLAAIGSVSRAQTAPVLSFNSAARLAPNVKAGLGPGAALFNGTIYIAMQGMGNYHLWISKTTDGVNVTTQEYTTYTVYRQPSVVVYNNKLYVGYNDQNGGIDIISSTDGTTFSSPIRIYAPQGTDNFYADSGPTMVVFNGNLHVFFQMAAYSTGNEIRSLYLDGSGWHSNGPCAYTPISVADGATDWASVGAAVFNNKLYVGTQIGSGTTGNTLEICSTTGITDPGTFSNYNGIHPEGGIGAAVYNGSLYFAFKGNTSKNIINFTGTTDGVMFDTPSYPSAYGINGTSGYEIAPALLPFNGRLWVITTANDNTHYLYSFHTLP